MVTTLNFKDIIDLPKWRPLAPPVGTGTINIVLAYDLRNNEDRHPIIYFIFSTGTINIYNVKTDEWIAFGSATLPTSVTCAFFMPAIGPRGTIAAGATTTSVPLSTALLATVGVNQLTNRGDGRGFKVRIIGNAAGSSGLTEERLVAANTGETTTPTITLDAPLSFTPIAGDTYEFLSGRIFMLGSSASAGAFKYYDILTNSFSGNLSVTNLTAGTDNILLGLDELFVPYSRSPGEGFFGVLTATASGAASLTGQAVGGDAGVVINEYRNFQIRIVQDIAIPTAVGQRRNITSHTAGPSPVYTVSAWAVTPSANAIYVIENNGDRLLEWSRSGSATSTYTISTNTWDQVTFSGRPVTPNYGMFAHQAFSIIPDAASPSNSRHSHIFAGRGGGSNAIDLFDIAGAATGVWTGDIVYGNKNAQTNWNPGTSAAQDPATMEGRYIYIQKGTGATTLGNPTQRFYRFDIKNRVLVPYTYLRVPLSTLQPSNPAIKIVAYTVFVDGDTKLSFIFNIPQNPANTAQLFFGLPIIR